MNGHLEELNTLHSQTLHLGKRKRGETPESKTISAPFTLPEQTKPIVQAAFKIIRKYDALTSISDFLSVTEPGPTRSLKRQKTNLNGDWPGLDTKFKNGTYSSLQELIEDIHLIKSQITTSTTVQAPSLATIDNIIDEMMVLKKSEGSSTKSEGNEASLATDIRPPSSVLSLRSQTESGIKQLFSGFSESIDKLSEAEGRKLPNGFEFTEHSTLDILNKDTQDRRTFGDVFRPHRSLKTLDIPQPSRPVLNNNLEFVPPLQSIAPSARFDHKYALTSTASWLRYSTTKARLPTADSKPSTSDANSALFKGAFSSFAPATDHSFALFSDFDRSNQWLRKHYKHSLISNVSSDSTNGGDAALEISDDFEHLLANFLSAEDVDDRTESEKILGEISELVETLSSYQKIRDVGSAAGSASISEPSKSEFDVYEMLRVQLQLLVDNLPPYAVSKLNGSQLEALNISTQMRVGSAEFSGTAQPDEITLRRLRAVQPNTISATRLNPSAVPARQSYATPTPGYTNQPRTYTNNLGGGNYTRPTASAYNGPRPSAAPQSPYGQTGYRNSSYTNPLVQQFQRPASVYGQNTTPLAQPTPSIQRPSQPGYQQRAQDSGSAYSRNDMTSGQNGPSNPPPTRHPLTIQQQQRLLQQQQQQQQQQQHNQHHQQPETRESQPSGLPQMSSVSADETRAAVGTNDNRPTTNGVGSSE